MNKLTERSDIAHPGSAELDRLRAGLLDASPAKRAAVLAHLDNCAECRARTALWPKVVAVLDEASADRASAQELSARRHRALHGAGAQRPRRAPIALALAAGVAAVAVGIGTLFLGQLRGPDEPVATAEAPGADLYVDLDFYLWLLHKQTDEGASPNG